MTTGDPNTNVFCFFFSVLESKNMLGKEIGFCLQKT